MSPAGSMKPPPEERLLRLIRLKRPQPAAPVAAASIPAGGVKASSLFARPKQAAGLRWLAVALGVLLVAEIAGLVVQIARPLPELELSADGVPASAEEPGPAGASLDDLPSVADSAPSGLFASPATSAASAATPERPPKTGMSGSAKQLASRLTLMGIVAGETPQAIIEDTETKKTYFVTAGQAVTDGALLEQVLDNRVILDFEGEKIELTL